MQPDLIISDLSMPRMNGETMLHAIRANEGIKETPIVMLTAMLEDERRITLLREGAQDYLVKPFSVEELRVRVDNLIAEKRAREMLRQELRMQNKDVADLSMEIERRKRQLNQALIDLRRSESRFRRLFDSNIIGIISATISGIITEANEKFLSILGYTREDLVMTSINWQRITPDEHRENDKRAIEQLLKNGVAEPWEKEYIRKDGTRVPVLLGLAMLEDSQVETVGFVVDLTEQRRAEDAQRFLADASSILVSSLDYQTIMQNLMAFCVPRFADWAALYMVDEADLRLVEIAAADEQLQLDLADLKEQGIEASEFNDVRTAINNNKPILIERVYQPANWRANINLENRETQVSIISLQKAKSRIVIPLQAHGRVIGAMLFNTAESNRYYTQSDLALAQELANRAALAVDNTRLYAESQQAVRARDEFMSVAAHELKTPITSLRGFSQLALKQFKRPEPDYARIQQSLDAIEFQSGKLAKLVAQLLGFARIQSGRLILEREMMDFAALTRNIIEEARLRTNEHTITLTAPDVFRIYADAIRLEQVVANLLDNAIKYSPEGGPVDAVLDVLPDPDKPERKIARLSIRDKGLGIPEEHRSHIFDRFYQAHRRRYLGGMGLGLYISREIVVMHGGQLVAEFPDDGGTRFVVTLPVITEESANG
jgi:PAS domain S-box-containing protein